MKSDDPPNRLTCQFFSNDEGVWSAELIDLQGRGVARLEGMLSLDAAQAAAIALMQAYVAGFQFRGESLAPAPG